MQKHIYIYGPVIQQGNIYLTHFLPITHFSAPWKRQKSSDFLTHSGGMEWSIGAKKVKVVDKNTRIMCWILSGFTRNVNYKNTRATLIGINVVFHVLL